MLGVSQEEIRVVVDQMEQLVPADTTLEDLANGVAADYNESIVLAVMNGKLCELFRKPEKDAQIRFLTTESESGYMTFCRSASLVMLKAFQDIVGKDTKYQVEMKYTMGNGLYCEYTSEEVPFSDALLYKVECRMMELIQENHPIEKRSISAKKAQDLFEKYGGEDKKRLFRFRMVSHVNIYMLDDYIDYFYGYMVPSTGYIHQFGLESYEDGFILNLPARSSMKNLESFVPKPKLFEIMEQSKDWGNTMKIASVADLNQQIADNKIQNLILVQEALQEKRIGLIADEIAKAKKKVVLIAGPSSSGKTTFSHRLSIQLTALGLDPHPIAMDDYFVNRERTPIDEKTGKYDFESIKALDTDQFNKDISDLLEGKEVAMPTFNFLTGQREYKGNTLKLSDTGVLVIEGIHGLNEICSRSIKREDKFKIYISGLTTLNIDSHNRITTSDGRLLRRIIRDARTRGASAMKTIGMWDSVRAGEQKNIFPHQEEADLMFNSSLIYEISVLKQFVQPLLFQVPAGTEEELEAKRLLKFLSYFLGVDSASVPNNSILREFIGGSCFF
ncbi:MAG: nucleoside kinase [Lachnospiraceae bacterium]|nr:nucleoside kinase [Lachnospiraceae bacterium]